MVVARRFAASCSSDCLSPLSSFSTFISSLFLTVQKLLTQVIQSKRNKDGIHILYIYIIGSSSSRLKVFVFFALELQAELIWHTYDAWGESPEDVRKRHVALAMSSGSPQFVDWIQEFRTHKPQAISINWLPFTETRLQTPDCYQRTLRSHHQQINWNPERSLKLSFIA